ncbi:hypothetical protein M0802_006753 [Mischocyttarus mexicanus]|nr:hypothetical protein M0802_006753 [Mischocyttarus mexicanus]
MCLEWVSNGSRGFDNETLTRILMFTKENGFNKFVEIRQLASSICIDSPGKPEDLHQPVGLYPCHRQGGNQYWMLSKIGEIRRDESCLDYSGQDVILYPCHGSKGNQQWIYNPQTKQIRHGSSDKCLAITESKQRLLMEECSSSESRQRWSFENYDPSKL